MWTGRHRSNHLRVRNNMQMMNICQSENVNHMVSTTVKESPGKLVEEFFSLFQFDQLECSHKTKNESIFIHTRQKIWNLVTCRYCVKNGQKMVNEWSHVDIV